MITITPQKNQQYQYSPLKQKQNKSFKGYTSIFSKELDIVLKQGKASYEQEMHLIDLLHELMKKKVSAAKLLGEGYYGKVYNIDSKYVLKVKTKSQTFADMLSDISKGRYKNLKTYYGEHIADFYDVAILKNMSPNRIQIPVGVPKKLEKSFNSREKQNYYEKVYLPLFASVPQRSYNAIARDCVELNKMTDGEYFLNFDYCNPNNFVLTGKSIRIADDIYHTALHNPNTAADLLEVFLEKLNSNEFISPPQGDAVGFAREIFKKLIIAANTSKLPLGDEISTSLGDWHYVTEKICAIKRPVQNFIADLKNIQQEFCKPKKCAEETKKYINTIIKEDRSI